MNSIQLSVHPTHRVFKTWHAACERFATTPIRELALTLARAEAARSGRSTLVFEERWLRGTVHACRGVEKVHPDGSVQPAVHARPPRTRTRLAIPVTSPSQSAWAGRRHPTLDEAELHAYFTACDALASGPARHGGVQVLPVDVAWFETFADGVGCWS